ncbi:MAG: hypothetical protein EOM59_21135 [Clostridia bacterium]|nr:hypothetical protein [Clostridia bacterium]
MAVSIQLPELNWGRVVSAEMLFIMSKHFDPENINTNTPIMVNIKEAMSLLIYTLYSILLFL